MQFDDVVTGRRSIRGYKSEPVPIQVGRVRLFLLDSNIEANHPDDRQLTSRLYGGDERTWFIVFVFFWV